MITSDVPMMKMELSDPTPVDVFNPAYKAIPVETPSTKPCKNRYGKRRYKKEAVTSRRRKSRSPSIRPDLWDAAERGDASRALQLINQGNDVNESYHGWTPLMKAAEEDHLEVVTILVNNGANVEAANKKGRSALSFAAAPSDLTDRTKRPTAVRALEFLLDCKAKVDPADLVRAKCRPDALILLRR